MSLPAGTYTPNGGIRASFRQMRPSGAPAESPA
jgi:hypothetical protein